MCRPSESTTGTGISKQEVQEHNPQRVGLDLQQEQESVNRKYRNTTPNV